MLSFPFFFLLFYTLSCSLTLSVLFFNCPQSFLCHFLFPSSSLFPWSYPCCLSHFLIEYLLLFFCYHYSWFCGVTSVMSTIFSAHLAMFLFPFLTLLALSLLEVWIFSLKSWFAVFQFLLFLLNNYPCFVAVCQGWQIACLK